MSFDWSGKEEEEFRDIPDETVEGQSAAAVANPARPRPQQASAPEQDIEPDLSQVDLTLPDEDEEEDYTEVLSDARLRLQQGQLYEMIMNHNLFDGLDADPKAINHVQREIRRFAKERMEIMLGMRREVAKVERLEIDFPFNALQVEILKKLASAATKGASDTSDRFVPEVKRTEEELPIVPKKTSLTPISGPKKAAPKQKLPSKPATPVARQKAQPKPQVPEEYVPLDKPISELTTEELIERNRQAALRQSERKADKPKDTLPLPTYEQQEMMYMQRAAAAAPAVSAIMALMNKPKT